MITPHFHLSAGRVTFGSTVALNAVHFHLDPAEFVVLLGANGSGKTTLVKTLLGLVPLSKGRLEVFGTPGFRFRDWGRIGYVPQRATAASGVPASAFEVVLAGRLARTRRWGPHRRADARAAMDALERVDMVDLHRKPVETLSGGQQQRVLIARALAGKPDVLVLDEPVSGVDLEHQESFAATLGALNRDGRSILLVAHALGVIEPLVTRAVVLTQGEVTYDGEPVHELHDSHVHHHPHSVEERPRFSHPAGGPR
ncbi:MAG: metal ABC transporter ATP-binding protein [Actinomycetota bacterium]